MQARPSDVDHMTWLDVMGAPSFRSKRVLDLGCGSGFLCQKAMQDGASLAVGIDIEKPEVPANTWQFRMTDLNAPDWQSDFSERFDVILAFDIIEHLNAPYNFLKSCHDLLATDGTLILTTPNTLSWERYYKPETWSGVRDVQHKVLFTRYSLDFLMKRVGFSSIELKAPVRKLKFLGPLQPHIGGQLFCSAKK